MATKKPRKKIRKSKTAASHPCADLIAYCRKMPAATEDIKWGKDLCFCIGEKIFAVFENEGGPTVSFKTSPQMFKTLIRTPGIAPAPYVGRFKWVLISDVSTVPTPALRDLIRESFEMIAAGLPRPRRKELGLDPRK